jgi:poly(3-hydroxybutyrate) depolymerase
MLTTLTLLLTLSSPATTVEDSALVPRDWLVIAAVDRRGRRPFRPDAVFLEHIHASTAGAPEAGQALVGERGDQQRWEAREASEKGELSGRIGYAYTSIESPRREVRLARLAGASTLYVNGRAHAGDVYRFGFGGVPVLLEAGTNHVYVTGARGGFQLTLPDSRKGLYHGGWDDTLPHLVAGEVPRGALGLELSNLSEEATGLLRFQYSLHEADDGEVLFTGSLESFGLQPLGVDQFALPLGGEALVTDGPAQLLVEVRVLGADDTILLEVERGLDVRQPGQKVLRTYISEVDGSVQRYAVVPPAQPEEGAEERPMRLALSLHGASVTAWRQAACYRQRPDFWLFAPENRRSFGFDWQDWGRRDAYDVLALGLAESGVDRRRVYVTGHSMGGHGTWHLAANDADGFAVCAPSAGWESFDSYGGRPEGELSELWHAADASSRTLELVDNLKQLPVYVLHGTADDNVPPSEALTMIEALTEAGGSFDVHFQGGAGHWWGDRCMDWPPIFETFRAHEIPAEPTSIDFTTVAPQVDAVHHWVRVEQPLRYGESSRVRGGWNDEEAAVELTTRNVGYLFVDRPASRVTLDEEVFELEGASGPSWFRREGQSWSHVDAGPPASEKRAARSGTLKRAFDRHFLMVVGTGGSADVDSDLLARARNDAGVWRYRGNGKAEIWTDVEFLERAGQTAGRNVILYGSGDTNGAWNAVLPEDCPIQVGDDQVELGGRAFEGDDVSCSFVYPRRGDDDALVGVFADTGPRATRIASTLAHFVSGVGYPDYVVFDSRVLVSGDGGVAAAGWFDASWRLPTD